MGAKVEAQLRRGPEALTLLSFGLGEGLYHAQAWDENDQEVPGCPPDAEKTERSPELESLIIILGQGTPHPKNSPDDP